MVGLVGGMKTAFLATNATIAVQYNVSYTAVTALTGVPLIVSAISGLVGSVAAKAWGRRPVYLAATLATLIGCIWSARTQSSYGSCMGARVVQGLGWGVFDTLVLTSIQDTYFVSSNSHHKPILLHEPPQPTDQQPQEHERNIRVTLYNVLNIAATWGSPLIGGVVSQIHGNSLIQFRIICGFFALALPLMILAAPETAFDRSRAAFAATPISGFITRSRNWQPWRIRHRLTKTRFTEHLYEMRPRSFHTPITKSTMLQIPRAIIAPTTILVFLLSFIPSCALWGYSSSLSLFLTPAPLSTPPSLVGTLTSGPWVLPTLVVTSFALYRGVQLQFTRLTNCLIICGGSCLALLRILSFGLGLNNFMSPGYNVSPTSSSSSSTGHFFNTDGANQLSLVVISFQIGILAASTAVLDSATRPCLASSASFTSSNMSIALRSISDMHTGTVILRNFAIGIFTIIVPIVSSSSAAGGMKAVAIGLAATQGVVASVIIAAGYFLNESIWRADGQAMGLVDLSSFKLSSSFFDTD